MCEKRVLVHLLFFTAFSKSTAEPQILRSIGGKDVSCKKYPFVVRLELLFQYNGQDLALHICTCSVLTPVWTLAASHCFTELPKFGSLALRYGSYLPNDANATSSKVLEYYIHQAYRKIMRNKNSIAQFENDIAVMKSEPIKLPKYAKLAAMDFESLIGEEALSLGFGLTNSTKDGKVVIASTLVLNKPLQELRVLIKRCERDVVDKMGIYPAMCLARVCGEEASACAGDSGGPLLLAGRVVGVMSLACSANDCRNLPDRMRTNMVGIVTPVSPFLDWIGNHLSETSDKDTTNFTTTTTNGYNQSTKGRSIIRSGTKFQSSFKWKSLFPRPVTYNRSLDEYSSKQSTRTTVFSPTTSKRSFAWKKLSNNPSTLKMYTSTVTSSAKYESQTYTPSKLKSVFLSHVTSRSTNVSQSKTIYSTRLESLFPSTVTSKSVNKSQSNIPSKWKTVFFSPVTSKSKDETQSKNLTLLKNLLRSPITSVTRSENKSQYNFPTNIDTTTTSVSNRSHDRSLSKEPIGHKDAAWTPSSSLTTSIIRSEPKPQLSTPHVLKSGIPYPIKLRSEDRLKSVFLSSVTSRSEANERFLARSKYLSWMRSNDESPSSDEISVSQLRKPSTTSTISTVKSRTDGISSNINIRPLRRVRIRRLKQDISDLDPLIKFMSI